MNQKEKRLMETELVKMGLAGLQANGEPTGELIDQIAAIVSTWNGGYNKHGEWVDRHKYLRDLLSECNASDRQEMYNALIPRLTFKAMPLHHYESMMAERVGNLVSKRAMKVTGDAPKPIEIGGVKVMVTAQEFANCGWAVVRCHVCDHVEKFLADTPVGAIIAAREAGWKKDPGIEREICPKCQEPEAVAMPLSRSQTLLVLDKRRAN